MGINSLDFECIISENETIDEAIYSFENAVIIVATGSCNTNEKIGHYVTLLKYKNNHKLLKGAVDNTASSNYTILQGILIAIETIKISTSIVVVTNTALGFQTGWFKNKGPNKEIIRKILDTIIKKKCTFKELQIVTKYESLNKFIAKYYPDELKADDKQKYVNAYTEKIKKETHKQTLEVVAEVLRRFNVAQAVINEVLLMDLPTKISVKERVKSPVGEDALTRIEFEDADLTIKELADRINFARREKTEAITADHIIAWLIHKGFLKRVDVPGRNSVAITEQADFIGILMRKEPSVNGQYNTIRCNETAQRFIVKHMVEIIGFNNQTL